MGVALIVGGFAILGVLVYLNLAQPILIHVPDGEEPIPYLQVWKALKWTKRVGKFRLFLMALSVGMVTGGFIVWVVATHHSGGPTMIITDTMIWIGFAASLLLTIGGAAGFWAISGRREELTPEEATRQAQREETARDRARRLKDIRRESVKIGKDIVDAVTRLGLVYLYTGESKGAFRKASRIRLGVIMYTDDGVYFKVTRYPFRVSPTDLIRPEVETNLSIIIGREVSVIHSTDHGLWFRAELKSGLSAIPKRVYWYREDDASNALDNLPKTGNLAFAVGVGENRKLHYTSLPRVHHLAIAGATRQGKTNWIHQFICTLALRNKPEQLRFVLVDLKRVEFTRYRGLPHLLEPVITDVDSVVPALERLRQEMEKRFNMFGEDTSTIEGWNAQFPNRAMGRIVFVMDELAEIMLDPGQGKKSRDKFQSCLIRLIQRGAGAGIHVVVATQITKREILGSMVMGNITERIAFRVGDDTTSMMILPNAKAARLPANPGRLVWKSGADTLECQGPYIEDGNDNAKVDAIKATVSKIIGGETERQKAEVTDLDLLKLALYNYGGKFAPMELKDDPALIEAGYSEYKLKKAADRLTYDFVAQNVHLIDGDRFILAPSLLVPGRGRFARRLLPVNGDLPASNEEIKELLTSGDKATA